MELVNLYEKMLLIRRVEEAIGARYSEKKMRCPVHLSIGQEAPAVGVCANLSNEDSIYSTHRCHAHYLAKGGNLFAMVAELYGKATGCAKGKGGSMHLVDPKVGMMGSSALVGGSIPIALGAAFKFKVQKQPNVAAAFFGDGATEEGILWESLNLAALKKLPVLFVCENNLYATYSHQKDRQASLDLVKKAESFGVEAISADGNDVEEVFSVTQKVLAKVKSGKPFFLEFKTYRVRDHVGVDYDFNVGYRTREEVQFWSLKCPLQRLEQKISYDDRMKLEQKIKLQIEEAFEFADLSPFPTKSAMGEDIYA